MKKTYKASAITKCFEAYYEMGESRSLLELERLSGVEYSVLKDWAEVYGWEEKVLDRKKELERTFEEGFNKRTRQIRDSLVTKMEGLVQQLDASSLGLPFSINNITDFKAFAQSYEALMRASALANSEKMKINSESQAPTTWSELLKQNDGE